MGEGSEIMARGPDKCWAGIILGLNIGTGLELFHVVFFFRVYLRICQLMNSKLQFKKKLFLSN